MWSCDTLESNERLSNDLGVIIHQSNWMTYNGLFDIILNKLHYQPNNRLRLFLTVFPWNSKFPQNSRTLCNTIPFLNIKIFINNNNNSRLLIRYGNVFYFDCRQFPSSHRSTRQTDFCHWQTDFCRWGTRQIDFCRWPEGLWNQIDSDPSCNSTDISTVSQLIFKIFNFYIF